MPGRTVGNISVTVDADTGKLKAQLVAAGEEGGQGAAEAIDEALGDIGGPKLKEAITKIRAQLEKGMSGIEAEVSAQVRKGDVEFARNEIEDALSGIAAAVGVDINWADVESSVEEINAAMQVDAEISANVSEASLAAAAEEINTVVSGIDAEIEPNVSETGLARVRAMLAAAGNDGGKAFGGGFKKGGDEFIPNQIMEWVPLVLASMQGLGPAVEGIAGGAIQVLSSAFSALGGAAGAAAPILAGLGATIAAIAIGSIGTVKAVKDVSTAFAEVEETGTLSDATLKKLDKDMRNLAPAAQEAVIAFAGLLPQFRAIQNMVAAHLFAGIGDELSNLGDTIPDIGAALTLAADSANRFGKEILSALKGIDFSGTFAAVQPALDSLGRAIANVVRAIEPFLKAAAPAARELATWIEQGSQSFLKMVQAGAGSGAITKFLEEGVSSLKDWAGLVKAVGDALVTLFQAGKSGGDGMVRSLTDIVNRWDAWMESARGQQALQDFFSTSSQLLRDMLPLVKGLADGLGAIFSGSLKGGFAEMAAGLGDVLRVLGELIGAISQANISGALVQALGSIARSLEDVMPQIERFLSAFGVGFTDTINGIASALGPVIGFLGNLLGALTPLAPVIGGIAAAFVAWKAITSIVSAVSGALSGLSLPMVAIGAAIGVAVWAFQSFGAQAKETAARTKELSAALVENVNAALETATSSTAAAIGMEQLSKTLANTGADGEKLTKSLGALGKTTDDSLSVLTSFAGGSEKTQSALEALARSAGLSGDGVADLAAKVAASEDPFWGVSQANTDLAAKLGISTEEMSRIGKAMEEVQDQAEKTDLQQLAQNFLDTSSAASESNQALLAQAKAQQEAAGTVGNTLDLYQRYTALLGENAASSNEAEAAQRNLQAGLEQSAKASAEAAQQMSFLETNLGPIAGSAFAAAGAMDPLAAAFSKAAAEADKGAAAADKMKDAFDKLISPTLNAEQAMSDYQQGVDDLTKSLGDAGGMWDASTNSINLNEQAGRDAAEAVRGQVEAIAAWGEAAIAQGQDAGFVQQRMQEMRAELVHQVAAFAGSEEAASAYIDQLKLTPENISTLVQIPGLIEAMGKVNEYDFNLDGIPDTKDTKYTATDLDNIRAKALEYGVDLSGIDDQVLTNFITQNLEQSQTGVDTLKNTLTGMDNQVATPTVTLDPTSAEDAVLGVQTGLNTLDTSNATPTVTLDPTSAEDAVLSLQTGVQGLDTVTGTPQVSVPGAPAAQQAADAVGTSVESLNSKQGLPEVAIVGNAIVMIQLAAITAQIQNLNNQKAAPNVSIPAYGTVVAQTLVMTAFIQQLNNQRAAPQVTLPTYPTVVVQTLLMTALLQQLGRTTATPTVSLPSYGAVVVQIAAIASLLGQLDRMNATPSVSLDGYSTVINELNQIANTLNSLNGRVATTTVRNVTQNITQTLAAGGIAGPMGALAGEAGPERARFPGGTTRLLNQPTVVPPGTVVTPLNTGGNIERQIIMHNNIEVNSPSADPHAVAVSVMNRAAAMAN